MRSIYQIAVLAISVSGAGFLAGCDQKASAGAGPGAAGGAAQPPPNVVVAVAETQDVPVYIDAIGKTMAVESVMITPRVAGQIVERRFEDGADITKDQVLFRIDPAPFEAALAAAKAQLASSKAALQLAQIELERYSAVAGTNAISKSDLDTKKNAVDVAQAAVEAGDAAVRTATINLDFCTIRSPIDGRAGARRVDVGNVVQENQGQLLSIQRVDPIWADFTINEQDLSRVRAEMANGRLKAFVRVANEGQEAERVGELTFLDNAVDGTGTVRLRATVQNADRHFWPGQFIQVRLVLKTLSDAVLVPTSAQQIGQGGPFVLVVKPDGTAEQRDVKLGQQHGDHVVITQGVVPGERVIIEGQLMVQPGGPVSVIPGRGPTSTPAASSPTSSTTPSSTRPASSSSSR